MRVCTKNYVIPGTKVSIDKGTMISIPTHAMQNDAQYFPEPDKFDPDRFSDKNRPSIKSKFVYLPFGDGPRQCIGKQ
jgi:cytochrome P450